MKFNKFLISALLSLVIGALYGQAPLLFDPDDSETSESCTSIMVGKKASTDGSVVTAHTCDANYRTWLQIVGRQTYQPGEYEPVYSGLLRTEEPWDFRNVELKGKIPTVPETFAYLNTAYPFMNEKQLAMGETTIVGKTELVNTDGYFHIEELQRVALQRCSTAKEAVLLIGRLAQEYGYGDVGECLTIADKKEIWQIEIFGSGPGDKPSAIWVAQRVPDDHVAVSANIPRISKVDFNSSDFLYSHDIKERCIDLGLWDGKEEFVFWKINHGSKPFSIREYFILNTLAPSLNLDFDAQELPFSVKPDKKVDIREILALYRETYEDTEWDQTKNLAVEVIRRDRVKGDYTEVVKPISNFMTNDMRDLLNHLKPGTVERRRTIAVIQCSYSLIVQLRDWLPDEVGGVAWFSFDNPSQSPRMPIYTGTIDLPSSFNYSAQKRYREDAAHWAFRETNRIATINWDKTRSILEPEIMRLEDKMFESSKIIEQKALELIERGDVQGAKELLTKHTHDFASMTIRRWQELKAELWTIFARSM